jgi:hypothetical protein
MYVKSRCGHNLKLLWLLILVMAAAALSVGCSSKTEVQHQKVNYELCSRTMLPDELIFMIEEKSDESFAFSYSTNDYTYIAVGYGLHDRDGYVVELRDIFATDYACYVKCAIMTQEYIDSLGDGVHICSEPSMSPYIVIRCSRLELPVMFSCG